MIRAGILDEDDKVELLEGYVVLKMPRDPEHDGTIQLIQENLSGRLPPQWSLRVQLSLALSDSQPEPDFAVVRDRARDYLQHHPGAPDTGLVVEVAKTSLLRDQRDKSRIYARAGIPGYWIVDVAGGVVEVYSRPSGDTGDPFFGEFQVVRPPDAIQHELDGVGVAMIPAADLLP